MAGLRSTVAAEQLEPRRLLAVLATLTGGDLRIVLGDWGDVAQLFSDGANYVVRGTGLAGFTVANASVGSVTVRGTGAFNQSFTVAAGPGAVLTDPLTVAASVERTTIVGAVDTAGHMLIDSASITLAADVTTGGHQTYSGAVGLVGSRTLSAGSEAVSFGGTVDSSPDVFVDPDAFAAGTVLTRAYPRITLSAVGERDAAAVVTSKSSDVATSAPGFSAPTGTRVFAGAAADGSWDGPAHVFKAAFAAPVWAVSLDFAPLDPNDAVAWFEAYDASGTLVASASSQGATPAEAFVTLSASAPSIASVRASFDGSRGGTGLLDALRASFVTTPAATLRVNSTGAVTFAAAVGGIAPLASLTTDAGGTVSLQGARTTGVQDYGDAAALAGTFRTAGAAFSVAGSVSLANHVTVSTGRGATAFAGTVDGRFGLTVNSTGAVTFAAAVGGVAPLASLTTDAGGTVSLRGARTTGGQAYGDAATLRGTYRTTDAAFRVAGRTALAGDVTVSTGVGAITFADTVDGSFRLTVNSTGTATFRGAVGSMKPLAGLTTDAGGKTEVEGGSVKTTGAAGQIYDDAVTLGKDATIDAGTGPVTFAGSVAPPTAGAQGVGGKGSDYGQFVTALADGSAIVTGRFEGVISFGGQTLTSNGDSDIYVARLEASGDFSWVRTAGGPGSDYGSGVAALPDGSVIVTGCFEGTASFGSTALASSGFSDVFVAKLDAAGNVAWAVSAGGADFDSGEGVAAFPDGSAVVTGCFRGKATFGSTGLESSGESGIFVAKLDAAGNFVWTRSVDTSGSGIGSAVSALPDGSTLIAGCFQGAASFGPRRLTSSGSGDIFVAKLDAAGSFVWASQAGGSGYDAAAGIAALADGSAIATGSFEGSAAFGSTMLTSGGADDAFVARFDAAGNVVWASRAGGTGSDAAAGVAVLADGSAIVTGSFEGPAVFGAQTLGSGGASDIFVARLGAAGDVAWANRAGGTGYDFGQCVCIAPGGAVLAIGRFENVAALGPTTLRSNGASDVFFAKLDAAGRWKPKADASPDPRLTVLSTGTTRFGGAVSGIGGLATDAGGTTEIAGGPITTVNDLVFNDAVLLLAATRLESAGDGTVAFRSTVDSAGGPFPLAIFTRGPTEFAASRVPGRLRVGQGTVSGELFASWSPPPAGAAGAVVDYVVQLSTDGGRTWQSVDDGVSTNRFAALRGLDPAKPYVVRVASVGWTGSAVPFTASSGGTQLTASGDLTSSIRAGGLVQLRPSDPATGDGLVRTVVAATLTGGNTVVTLSSPLDGQTTLGTLRTTTRGAWSAASAAVRPRSSGVEFVTVGDPGNPPGAAGGSVAYDYRIGRFEFTNAQYTAFLNAVDPQGLNPNGIYDTWMGTNPASGGLDAYGGIVFNAAAAAGGKYAPKPNMGDKPVNFVSWWDAARVANWLHHGAVSYAVTDASAAAPQNTGAYPLGTAEGQAPAPARNPGALYWLPTQDEWVKAAYFKGGGGNAGYWLYATRSDDAPGSVTAGPAGAGSAGASGSFANYGSTASWNGLTASTTTVGTNGGPSAYGAFDMGGNVREWNDLDGAASQERGLFGGSARSTSFDLILPVHGGNTGSASSGDRETGFRLSGAASPVAFLVASVFAPPQAASGTRSETTARLSWRPPPGSASLPNLGYVVQRSADGGQTWETVNGELPATARSFQFTGLEPRRTYLLRVAARSSFGAGAFTEPLAPAERAVVFHAGADETITNVPLQTGVTRLIARGPGTLVLDKANAHAGGTVIESGVVVVGHGTALASGPLEIRNDGEMRLALASGLVAVSRLQLGIRGRIDVGSAGLRIAAGGFGKVALEQAIAAGRINAASAGRAGFVSLVVDAASGDAIVAFRPNRSPTAIALSATRVGENLPVGTVVGTLSTSDPDSGDSFRYVLVADPLLDGSDAFEVVGNRLRTKAVFNAAVKASYSVRIRSFDKGGLFTGRVFTITVGKLG